EPHDKRDPPERLHGLRDGRDELISGTARTRKGCSHEPQDPEDDHDRYDGEDNAETEGHEGVTDTTGDHRTPLLLRGQGWPAGRRRHCGVVAVGRGLAHEDLPI